LQKYSNLGQALIQRNFEKLMTEAMLIRHLITEKVDDVQQTILV